MRCLEPTGVEISFRATNIQSRKEIYRKQVVVLKQVIARTKIKK